MPKALESPARTDITALTALTLAVFRLNGVLLQWGDLLVAPLGLTSARWQMLGAIALTGRPLTAPQVGAAMGVTRQGAQKQLNVLLGLGLVETLINSAHKRSPLYALTARGRRLYGQAERLWVARSAELARRLPAARARAATATLDAMCRHLNPPTDSPKVP
jgi:DNA-binding MarR family transcriptional regulator